MLQSGGVNDHVDSLACALQPLEIANISEKEANPIVFDRLRHLILLQLVATEDDDLMRLVLREHGTYELRPKRAGSTGHEDSLVFKHLG